MNHTKKIAVFGATGKVGKELLQLLSQAEIPAIAVTRKIEKALSMPFIEWAEADMSDRAGIIPLLERCSAVFLASGVNQHFVTQQSNVITAAEEAGVSFIVKLSSPGSDKHSANFISRPNGAVEDILKQSGMGWAILQPNSFMQNWLGEFAATIKAERKIYEATGDGKKPYIDTRDVAAVALAILKQPGQHLGQTYLLTGGEAVNYAGVATAISQAIGEEVVFVSLNPEEARQRMESKGMPPMMVDTFLAIAEGQRNGQAAFVNNAVQGILNRKPLTVADFAREYVAAFR